MFGSWIGLFELSGIFFELRELCLLVGQKILSITNGLAQRQARDVELINGSCMRLS
jgi:hypothetical protein